MAAENRDIKYLNKDFGELRNALVEYTKTYFPATYNDFSPSSPGMLFLEMSAYVGDVLSFYLDNQIQENFVQFARQQNNLYTLAYMLGYKPKVTGVAVVDVDIYQQIPSVSVGGGEYAPDYRYAVFINNNTILKSSLVGTTDFVIQDTVDFAFSSSLDPTQVSILTIDTVTNQPEFYLLKKTRKAISANIQTATFTFGSPQRFQTIEINSADIIGILDIEDSGGNKWYEVPYLAQEMVYDNIKNTLSDSGEVPYLLQLLKAPRRFVTRFTSPTTLQIQFGAGTTTANVEEEIIPNPTNVGNSLDPVDNNLTTAYDPANFLYTSTYGIAPSNTTLTIRYLTGGGVAANIPANSFNGISNTSNITTPNPDIPDAGLATDVINSVTAQNPTAATGGSDGDTVEEIRQNSLAAFGAQLRTVTQDDYLVRALSLPSQYGSLAKIYAEPERLENLLPGESLSSVNLYVLAYDNDGKLKNASTSLKNNLKVYLAQYRMVNDSIKIRDGFVINIGVDFDIIVLPNYNNNDVLFKCITAVKDYFNIDKWQINEPIILKDIYVLLDRIDGVQTVKNISITNKCGSNYSIYAYDVIGATQNNVIYPSVDPMIFEVKYPDSDIKGRVVSL
jgi:hypothetical protein